MSKLRNATVSHALVAGLAISIVALAAGPGDAQPLQPFWQIYPRDNVQELRPLAEKGDPGAQFQLGTKYLTGRWPVKKDISEGLHWLRASAEQGFIRAQLHLGTYYANTGGNDPAALAWLRRAAENIAERDGVIAARGAGVILSRDPGTSAEAAGYFRRAAERGDLQAQVLLGALYLDGRGVERSFDEGLRWIERAATANYVLPKYVLTFIYAEGFGTPPNVLEAASRLFGARTDRTETQALYSIGTFYERGFWIEKEDRPILSWVLARMGAGDEAIRQWLREEQRGHSSYRWADRTRALTFYRKAAEAGDIGAQVNLGHIYFDHRGSNWDCAEGMKWTRMAADRGDPTAQLNVGYFYRQGPDRSTVQIGITMTSIPEGFRVESVDAGGAAARAGLRMGDRIVGVRGVFPLSGESLATYGALEFAEAMEDNAGKKVVLLVRREGSDAAQSIDVVPERTTLKCPGAEAAGLRADPVAALQWFEKSANGGHPSGLFFLAEAYREGKGTAQNQLKAMELYRRGADGGDWQAAQAISHMYAAGDGVEKSKELSEEWFRKAIQLRHRSVGCDFPGRPCR